MSLFRRSEQATERIHRQGNEVEGPLHQKTRQSTFELGRLHFTPQITAIPTGFPIACYDFGLPTNMRPWLYTAYFVHALIFSFIISQFDFLATALAVIFTVLGAVLWRRKRPDDFIVRNYMPRVLVSSTYALVSFVGFFLLRELQPMNYRRNDLAALGILSALLAIYFATAGRN